MDLDNNSLKGLVKEHWERESCGARNGMGVADRKAFFENIERIRYEQDYMIKDFADFSSASGKKVLEVGLGTGTDFMQWCRADADVYGRDLTVSAVDYVKERLQLEGLQAHVATGDAENLDLPDDFFDIYYSWGVLHHTADPEKAFAEAHRVLKPGGTLKVMLYHYHSVATFLIWLLYGPLRLKWHSARECVFHHVESIGTKVYSCDEVMQIFGSIFPKDSVRVQTFLGAGDLLTHTPSGKYQSGLWRFLIAIYPTWLIRHLVGHRFGSVMTVTATKSLRSERA